MSNTHVLAILAEEELEVNHIQNEVIERHDATADALATSVFADNIQSVVSDIPNAEPISHITLQSIQLAIESICQNLGADSTKYFSISAESYSKQVVLEDMRLFVNDLWSKIKKSIEELWNKIGEFWNDNFASLNKIKAALEHALEEVNSKYKNSSQVVSDKMDEHILLNFNNGEDINDRTLINFISAHYNNFNTIDSLIKNTKYFNKHVKDINQSDFESGVQDVLGHICKEFTTHTFKLGTERSPMISGEYIDIDYVMDDGTDIQFNAETNKIDYDDNRRIYLVTASHLKTVIMKALDIIKQTMHYKETQHQLQTEFNNVTKTYDSHMQNNGLVIDFDDISQNKTKLMVNYKTTLRLIYRINSSIPKLLGTMIVSNVKLARSIASYSHFCLTHS
jgi:hypothetical protein